MGLFHCDKILFSYTPRWTDTNFFFLIRFLNFSFFCYFMLFCYHYYFILLIFFSWTLFLFFHVPECSGMFQNVPWSWFYRLPVTGGLITATIPVHVGKTFIHSSDFTLTKRKNISRFTSIDRFFTLMESDSSIELLGAIRLALIVWPPKYNNTQ